MQLSIRHERPVLGSIPIPPTSVEPKYEIAEILAFVKSENVAAQMSKDFWPYVTRWVSLAKLHVAHVNRRFVEVGLLKQDVEQVRRTCQCRLQSWWGAEKTKKNWRFVCGRERHNTTRSEAKAMQCACQCLTQPIWEFKSDAFTQPENCGSVVCKYTRFRIYGPRWDHLKIDHIAEIQVKFWIYGQF